MSMHFLAAFVVACLLTENSFLLIFMLLENILLLLLLYAVLWSVAFGF